MPSPVATNLGVRRLLTAAGQAPSVLNTQPWRFRIAGREHVELYGDRDRKLTVSDPRGRSLHVSCGAALFNLRLAVRVAGYRPRVRLLPTPDGERDLLAAVHMAELGAPTAAERDLYEQIGRRRTNREPFSERHVPRWVMSELRKAAAREGARLVPLDHADTADLLDYVTIAEDGLLADHGYLAELAAWTMRGAHADGIPAYTLGPRSAADPSPVRDLGAAHPGRPSARFEPQPQLAVLTTPGDRRVDWLRAGQALQRMLLVATMHGVSASFLNQPLDLRDMRHRTDPYHRRGHAQMIIRFGYGPAVPRAPRRPPAELMPTY
ncbi:Acg family FMN-binding oxidoreductase [Sphaerimonospora thailandensis]|uniref:Nitroreductase n=1 Tax=Sphaerimonospora thailandensis TaxID=795644 RepID=A0A8J3RAS8_9ACTN|nr:nitroreductase family protein [Sphaerimonospora thailandensis]GIH72596.1 nitroreductase [Sphaerimonospora thailandensis]